MYVVTKKLNMPNMIWDAKNNCMSVVFDEKGVFTTDNEVLAKKLKAAGHRVIEQKEIDDMTIAELKQYAEDYNIELGDAAKKADILAVIRDAG